MKIETLITRIREDYLDDTLGVDDDDSLVKESSLLRFAEEAEIQACRRNDFIYDETTADICTVTLVDSQSAYRLDSRITKLERVSIDGKNLIHTTEDALDDANPVWRQTDTQTPTHFYVRGTTIYLYPTPDSITAAKTLDLAVYRLPLSGYRNSRQSFEIIEEATDDLIYWMLYRVYNLRDEDLNDPTQAMYYATLFDQSYGPVTPLDVRIHQFESPALLQHGFSDKYSHNSGMLGDDDLDETGW